MVRKSLQLVKRLPQAKAHPNPPTGRDVKIARAPVKAAFIFFTIGFIF
jgi:hypothetical protein